MLKNLSKSKKITLIICVILVIVIITSITLLFVFKNKYSGFEKFAYALDSADINSDTLYDIIDNLEQNNDTIDYILQNKDNPEKLFSNINDVDKFNSLIDILQNHLTSSQLASFIHNYLTAPKSSGLNYIGSLFKYYDRKKIDKIKKYKTINSTIKIKNDIDNNSYISSVKSKEYNLSISDWNEFTNSCYSFLDYIDSLSKNDIYNFINTVKNTITDETFLQTVPIQDLVSMINIVGKGLINVEDYKGIFNVLDYYLDDKLSTALVLAPYTFKCIINISSEISANELLHVFGDYPDIEKIYNNVFYLLKTNIVNFEQTKYIYSIELANAFNIFDCDKKYTVSKLVDMFEKSRNIYDIGLTKNELNFWSNNMIKTKK